MASQRLFIDLFAGCGGLSLGLQKAGWQSLFAVEAHPHAFATYQHNHLRGDHKWPEWLAVGPARVEELIADHRRQLGKLAGKISLVAGGPPCQGFSTAGRRRSDDPRNRMVRHYLDFLELVQPTVVMLENVRGFTTMRHETSSTYADYVTNELEALGYRVSSQLLIASDWGVPQRRPRYVVIAVRDPAPRGVDPFLRLRVRRRGFLEERGLPVERPTTAAEAIGDLCIDNGGFVGCSDSDVAGFQQLDYKPPANPTGYLALMRANASGAPNSMRLPRHSDATRNRFSEILDTCPRGRAVSAADRKRLNTLKRSCTPLAADQPSTTVTTLPDDIIHYAEPRILTARECARLQSFPDTFEFRGPYTTGGPQRSAACPRYTQIGNAVPPLLAEALGEALLTLCTNTKATRQSDKIVEMNG